jgi:hypothetical protein
MKIVASTTAPPLPPGPDRTHDSFGFSLGGFPSGTKELAECARCTPRRGGHASEQLDTDAGLPALLYAAARLPHHIDKGGHPDLATPLRKLIATL